jgi:hypothetical protein
MDDAQVAQTAGRSRWVRPRFRPVSLSELFVVCVLLTFGCLYIVTVPIGGGWDEETHVVRVWELARLSLIPNSVPRNGLPFPAIYWNLSYRRPVLIRPVDKDFWSDYGNLPIDAFDYIYSELRTRSVYSPPLLLPQAIVMRYLGLTGRLPALPVYYICRLAGLLSYCALVLLAVRLAPFGKWTLAVLALGPTAVFQASTIGTDPISNGLGLLFIAGCLAVSFRQRIGRPEWAALVSLSFLLFLGKPNMVFLAVLPLIILSRVRFKMRGGLLLLGLAIATLGLIEVAGWAYVAYGRFSAPGGDLDPVRQIMFVATHPFTFLVSIAADFAAHGISYIHEWLAEYGYGYWVVPWPTFPLCILAVAAAMMADSGDAYPPRRTRIGLFAVFLLAIVGTSLSLYLAFTPIGNSEILGVQGRYYTAIIPLLALGMIGLPLIGRKPIRSGWAMGLAAASLASFGAGMYLSYHVPCGTSYYELGLCYQPMYKNWSPNARYSQPISDSLRLTQDIVPECEGAAQIRVWVDSTGAIGGGSTEFILHDLDSGQALAHQTFSNSELPRGGWADLDFEPDWESSGKHYVLEILPGASVSGPGPRVALSLRPEYPAGELHLNQSLVDTDIIFEVGCSAGLQRILSGFGG